MKKNVLRIVKVASLVLAVTVTLGLLQSFVLFRADHNTQRVKGFYTEEEETLDVVILGASEVYSDFAPGYAYAHSGVTSYLFATQANSILNYKSQLKNILSRQQPDLIVIELNGAVYGNEEEVTDEANLHNYADNVPLDGIKLDWLFTVAPENPLEYLFPLIKYHSVWEQDRSETDQAQRTVDSDRSRGYNYLKGILNETAIYQSSEISYNSDLPDLADQKKPITSIEESALRDLLQYCKDEGLENVVFARFPHIVVTRTYERFERSNTVGAIVAEYGYDYLNFELNFAETGLDEANDFYNLDHLNIYGQKKFTAFLTDYLTAHYGLTSGELADARQEEWETCAGYYDAYYRYSDELIRSGEKRELSENCELIDTLKAYLN